MPVPPEQLRQWAESVRSSVAEQLRSDEDELGIDLAPCGKPVTEKLTVVLQPPHVTYSETLDELMKLAYENLKASVQQRTPLCWRRLYAEAAMVWTALDCIAPQGQAIQDPDALIARLDHAIIITGAPGEGRLDLFLDFIEQIQKHCLPLESDVIEEASPISSLLSNNDYLPSTALHVPELIHPPSLSQFQTSYYDTPFVIRSFASSWPVISEKRWCSKAYLLRAGGRGRIVPVEVGSDYRSDDWTQTTMKWEDYLDYIFPGNELTVRKEQVVYLAQHDLFKQFPQLRWDIVVPDYVYCSLSPPTGFPEYQPPANTEQLVLNAWLGPKGTVSPAHTDPFYNVYVQVVGQKTVWFAPPSCTPYLSRDGCWDRAAEQGHHPAANQENPMLSNTSRLDVFSDREDDLEDEMFRENVAPKAMSTVLGPGDLLFFPPGWWHAMRSESVSFSVSMWF